MKKDKSAPVRKSPMRAFTLDEITFERIQTLARTLETNNSAVVRLAVKELATRSDSDIERRIVRAKRRKGLA